jgi:hypothetical protein
MSDKPEQAVAIFAGCCAMTATELVLAGMRELGYSMMLMRDLYAAHKERDFAIDHDRQPYPTAWAYEQVCKARDDARARIAELEQDLFVARQAILTEGLARGKAENKSRARITELSAEVERLRAELGGMVAALENLAILVAGGKQIPEAQRTPMTVGVVEAMTRARAALAPSSAPPAAEPQVPEMVTCTGRPEPHQRGYLCLDPLTASPPAEPVPAPKPEADRCECGHMRSAHEFGADYAGLCVATDGCPCTSFRPAAKKAP